MYKYPKIARTNLEDVKLPDCMYKMNPIYVEAVVPLSSEEKVVTSNGSWQEKVVHAKVTSKGSSAEAVDEHKLLATIAYQEKLLKRIGKMEEQLLKLTGDKSLPKVKKSPECKKPVFAGTSDTESTAKKILSQQEDLIRKLEALVIDAKKETVVVDASVIKSLSNQKTLDVSLHVEIGSSLKELNRFVVWLKQKAVKVLLQTYFHSSTVGLKPCQDWKDTSDETVLSRTQYDLTISLIVKKVGLNQTTMILNPSQDPVVGEKAIIEHLSKALSVSGFK